MVVVGSSRYDARARVVAFFVYWNQINWNSTIVMLMMRIIIILIAVVLRVGIVVVVVIGSHYEQVNLIRLCASAGGFICTERKYWKNESNS